MNNTYHDILDSLTRIKSCEKMNDTEDHVNKETLHAEKKPLKYF